MSPGLAEIPGKRRIYPSPPPGGIPGIGAVSPLACHCFCACMYICVQVFCVERRIKWFDGTGEWYRMVFSRQAEKRKILDSRHSAPLVFLLTIFLTTLTLT